MNAALIRSVSPVDDAGTVPARVTVGCILPGPVRQSAERETQTVRERSVLFLLAQMSSSTHVFIADILFH